MAKHLGLEWPRDRVAIVEKINEMRLEIRNRFPDASIFRECAYVVPIFKMEDISGSYPGFTLPDDMASISAAWIEHDSTTLRSRWREKHTGILSHSALELQVVPMMHTSVTEADLSCGPQLLQVRPCLPCDDGKIVEIKVCVGQKTKKISFSLSSETWKTTRSGVTSIEQVTLPADLCGSVTLREAGGRLLSIYQPGNEVPAYQRYKVATTCTSDHIILKGPKIFRDVFDDNDIVEVGDRAVLRHAASYLRYSENTTDVADLRRAKYDEGLMRQHLNGVMARLDGEQTEDTALPNVRHPRPTRRLKGYQRRKK